MNTKYIFLFTLILSILGFFSCSANEIDSLNSGLVLPNNNADEQDITETPYQNIHTNHIGGDNITFTPSSSNGRRIEISFYPLIIFVLYFILS